MSNGFLSQDEINSLLNGELNNDNEVENNEELLSDLEKELPIAEASKTTLKDSGLGNTPGTYKLTFTWSVTDGKISDTPTVSVGK